VSILDRDAVVIELKKTFRGSKKKKLGGDLHAVLGAKKIYRENIQKFVRA
jgi:hypothetical protein